MFCMPLPRLVRPFSNVRVIASKGVVIDREQSGSGHFDNLYIMPIPEMYIQIVNGDFVA